MNEETGKTKAVIDPSASNQRMRELLQKVAGIAEAALANQPEGDGPAAWCHLGAAVVNVRKAMRPEPGTLAFMDELEWCEKEMAKLRAKYGAASLNPGGNPPAEAQSRRAEKPLDPNAPDEKKAVGNFAGQGKVVSYAIDKNCAVTVTASTCGDGTWNFKGTKDGCTMIEGSIFGGKWKAVQYCKFIRNGIVSRAKRLGNGRARRPAEPRLAEDGSPHPGPTAND